MGSKDKRKARAVRQVLFIILVLGLLVGGLYGYVVFASQPPTVSARFSVAEGKLGDPFLLEVVATPQMRARGLMFRKPGQMAPNEGMIFVFPRQEVQTFWMHNTFLPLDMIFVDRSMKVVGVLHDVPTLNDNPRSVGIPSTYVIELNAGAAKKQGITAGSVMKIDQNLPIAE